MRLREREIKQKCILNYIIPTVRKEKEFVFICYELWIVSFLNKGYFILFYLFIIYNPEQLHKGSCRYKIFSKQTNIFFQQIVFDSIIFKNRDVTLTSLL
jgi:hypothetical protein